MNSKLLVYILLYLPSLVISGCITTRKIKLKSITIANRFDRQPRLAYLNYADTAFVALKNHGDFGMVNGTTYEFNSNLRNSKYLVFINDTVVEKQVFKNGRRDGPETIFRNGVIYGKVPYVKGKPQGTGYFFFKSGNVNEVVIYENGRSIIRWTYNENHELTREEFFINDITVRLVDYDRAGRIKTIRNEQRILNVDPDEIGSLQDGKKEYKYLQGTITIYYKKGKNKKWVFSPVRK